MCKRGRVSCCVSQYIFRHLERWTGDTTALSQPEHWSTRCIISINIIASFIYHRIRYLGDFNCCINNTHRPCVHEYYTENHIRYAATVTSTHQIFRIGWWPPTIVRRRLQVSLGGKFSKYQNYGILLYFREFHRVSKFTITTVHPINKEDSTKTEPSNSIEPCLSNQQYQLPIKSYQAQHYSQCGSIKYTVTSHRSRSITTMR